MPQNKSQNKYQSGGSNNAKNVGIYFVVLILGLLLFATGFFIGRFDLTNRQNLGNVLHGELKQTYNDVDVNIVWEVWDKIDQGYLKKDINGQGMVDGMVKGLVDSLNDPYTVYLNKEETADYLKSNAGEFEGIGVTLRYNGEYTQVETTLSGYPAIEAGVRAKDTIIEVDGKSLRLKKANEVSELIRGKAGTNVKIKVVRDGVNDPISFEITRKKIDIDSITYEEVKPGIYKITINQFTESDLRTFQKQWDQTVSAVKSKNPDGIIIDLRNNPGGYVDAVVYTLGDFFPENTLVMMEEDRNGNKDEMKTIRGEAFKGTKIVVLVNEGSASSSEIFAGAIQDHKRGKIIGVKTVGKGVEQRIFNLSNGGSLHLVFQKWLLPSGRNITAENPITPDIQVELTEKDFQKGKDPQLDRAVEELKK